MAQRTRRGFLKYGAVLGPAFAALQPSVLFGQLQDAARTLGPVSYTHLTLPTSD